MKVESLRRTYGDMTAVDDVSFTIGRGEVVGLLGHNGAGKTTIMKMLTGYLEPTAGTIRIDDLTIGPDTAAIQVRIGYLPENCPMWPEMTVIVSTHILQEVQAVCERVLILRTGQLVVDSRLDELQQSPALLVAVAGDARETLSRVEGVTEVSELQADDGLRRYRVTAPPAAADLALHELNGERHDLETVFAQVNEEVAHA